MHTAKPMKKVRVFRGSCRGCGHTFALPSLSDFSYGEVILTGDQGTTFSYLTLHNPIADEVRGILENFEKDQDESALQRVLSRIADTLDGQTLQLQPVCPACRSNKISVCDSEIVADREIPITSFRRFLALPKSGREKEVVDILQKEL